MRTHSSTSPTSYLYIVHSNDPPVSYYPQQVRSDKHQEIRKANARLGGDSLENFSRNDALKMTLKHQVSDRILRYNGHHTQKLPLEEIFRCEAIIETTSVLFSLLFSHPSEIDQDLGWFGYN